MLHARLISYAAVLSAALLWGCDQGAYRPNADPLGIEEEQGDAMSDPSTDLPELPTLSDVETQEDAEPSTSSSTPKTPSP